MEIVIVDSELEGGEKAFDILKNEIKKGAETLGLATGSTPETFYQEIVNSDLDFSEMYSINLDEYVGLGKENNQSYHYFMKEKLFEKKPFKKSFLPNGKAENLKEECQKYDKIITEHPIDLQILGIGENAHIGFNEPGTSFDSQTHLVNLTESTINANKRNFDSVEDVPTQAISMGIASIMKAEKIILIAYGEKKAEAIKNTIEGPVTEEVPASILQKHDNLVIILDEAAAKYLKE